MNPSNNNIETQDDIGTTGHEWDGITELNYPCPRWWVWIFLGTIVWAVGYWYIYPAWPVISGDSERGGTKGVMEWTQYKQLEESQSEIFSRRAENLEKLQNTSTKDVMDMPELYEFAVVGGKSAFKENCAQCHGSGGGGAKGYPNLNDDDWLWGGSLKELSKTIKYGIRSDHKNTRNSVMPPLAAVMGKDSVTKVSRYVAGLSNGSSSTAEGAKEYKQMCSACHGVNGEGNRIFGAPKLSDGIWLYGKGDEQQIESQIKSPQHGVMPAWIDRLGEDTIKQLVVYVYSLGGGE